VSPNNQIKEGLERYLVKGRYRNTKESSLLLVILVYLQIGTLKLISGSREGESIKLISW